MTRVRLLVAGLLAACGLVLVSPSTSYACSCVVTTPERSARWADVIFVGTLTDVEPPPQREIMSSGDPNTFTFDVRQVLEGDAGSTVEVQSAMESATCGWQDFEIGEEYVIFATTSRAGLQTGLCSGNAGTSDWLLEKVESVTGPAGPRPPDLGRLLAPFAAIIRFLS